jgi:fibronectin-binding autotransporter adhesin
MLFTKGSRRDGQRFAASRFLLAGLCLVVWTAPAAAIDLTYTNNQNQTEPITVTENTTLQTQAGGTEVAVQSGNVTFSSPFILTLRPIDAADQLTVSGVISGGGSLAIDGAGKAILSGNNTFTGGIAVNGAGTLSARNNNAFGTGTVTINNAAATVSFGNLLTVSNAFILNTNSTFSTLSGGLEDALLTGTVDLGGNTLSLVTFEVNDNLGLDGIISGTGAITVSGGGAVRLGGANTFTGGVTITGTGSVNATNSSAFGTGTVTVNNDGATVGFGGGVNAPNDVVLMSDATFTVAGDEFAHGQLSGNVALGDNTVDLFAEGTGQQLTLSGTLSGTGAVTVDGGGVVVLSGASTYTGGTTVNGGGTLVVNGSITGATTVTALATLGGEGTIGSLTLGGTLNPGSLTDIGTLTTTGNVVFNTGSFFTVQLDAGGGSDLLNVGGTTTINSGVTVDANLTLTSFTVGQTFTILDSTGAISGSFGSITSNFNFLGLSLVQVGNTIQVEVTSVNTLATIIDEASFSSAVATANAAANGSAIAFSPGVTVDLTANAPAFNLGTKTIYLLGFGATLNGNGFTALTLTSGTLVMADLTVNGAVQLNGGTLGIGTTTSIGTLSGVAGSALNLLGDPLTITEAENSTFSGVISGPGSLVLEGPGTLTLAGVNSYSGGTTLNGTGGAIATGNRAFGTGDILFNNAAAFIGVGDRVVLPNDIIFATPGQIETLSGGTESATLSGDLDLGANALTLLAFDAGDILNVNGDISGTAGLTIDGAGTVALGGANTFTGDVSLEGEGAVRANDDMALGAGMLLFNNADATLQLGNEVDVANAVVMNTAGTIGTASGGTQVATLSSDVDTQGNSLILKPEDAADKVTLTGIISGAGGVTKEGAGTAVLAADETYTGGTVIDAGTLLLTGTVSGATVVNEMGTFGGTGTLTGDLAVSGTVAPGASIGTLNVVGNVAFDSTSTFNPEISTEDGADLLNVTGTLDFDGGRLLVSPVLGDFPIDTSYTVATASGGITGAFDTLESSVHFFLPSYEINGNDLTVSLEVRDIGEFAQTPNQLAMAGLVNEILQNAATPDGRLTADQIFVFDSLFLNEDEIPAALDQISGAGQSTFATTAIAELTQRNNNLTRHINYSRRCYLPNRDEEEFRSNCVVLTTKPGKLARSGENIARAGKGMFWVNGYHGTATGSPGFGDGFDLMGLDLGFDGWLQSGILIGMSGGYSRVQGDNFTTVGRGETEKGYASVYASKAFGNGMYATGIFTAGFGDMETFRAMTFGDVDRAALGHFNGHILSGYGEFGVDLEKWKIMIQPFAAVQYLGINFSNYTETSAGALDLQVDGMSIASIQGVAGVRLSRVFYDVFWGFNVEPELYVKFTQEFAGAKDDLVTEVKFIDNVNKASIVSPGSFSSGLSYGGSVDVSRAGKMRFTFDIDFFQSSVYDITTLGGRASWVF